MLKSTNLKRYGRQSCATASLKNMKVKSLMMRVLVMELSQPHTGIMTKRKKNK